MRKIYVLVAMLPLFFAVSCISEDDIFPDADDLDFDDTIDDDDLDDVGSDGGSIYYKWIQTPCEDCNSCTVLASKVRDNNDAVSDYALEDYNYGPSEPGTFSGEYYLGSSRITYNYTLATPPQGYDRYYTHEIMAYDWSLNRCLNMAVMPSSLTYVDVPAGSADPDQEVGGAPKYVQFYANPQSFSMAAGLVVNHVKINGNYYYPKSFVDNCTEYYVMVADGTNYGRDKFSYEISIKNYNSLDAAMNGLQYSTETGGGIIYLDDLAEGCNTLETVWNNGYRMQIMN